jgi:hypothetical protein
MVSGAVSWRTQNSNPGILRLDQRSRSSPLNIRLRPKFSVGRGNQRRNHQVSKHPDSNTDHPNPRRNNVESFATLISVDGFRHDSHSSVAALRLYSHPRNAYSRRAGIHHSHRRNTQRPSSSTRVANVSDHRHSGWNRLVQSHVGYSVKYPSITKGTRAWPYLRECSQIRKNGAPGRTFHFFKVGPEPRPVRRSRARSPSRLR